MKKHMIFVLTTLLLLSATGDIFAFAPLKDPVRQSEEAYEVEAEEESDEEWKPAKEDIEIIAKILYHECRGCTKTEQSGVVWTILNRVDSDLFYFPDTIQAVCKQKNQFAYLEDAPVLDDLLELAEDVLIRHHREANGEENVGRTLPAEYVYFWGDGFHNHFRIELYSRVYWDWSLPSPYED